jgi:hypothetical protein
LVAEDSGNRVQITLAVDYPRLERLDAAARRRATYIRRMG